ncbi:MAG: nickel-dependent hydrogenase large subunit [Flammeovirgaceae bacterium]
MKTKITIDPVTRVEGHGRVTIHLDEYGKVLDSFFHIVEFRGFERFIQGRPYWEAPVLVQRLCGICPVSHHLAAAKAIDQLVGIDPENLTLPAQKLRRLLHYAQIFQSHALHFFYLASRPPIKRNRALLASVFCACPRARQQCRGSFSLLTLESTLGRTFASKFPCVPALCWRQQRPKHFVYQ